MASQIQATVYFYKWSFISTQSSPFSYRLIIATFTLQRQSLMIATKTIQPAKTKIFIIWLFTEKSLPIPDLKGGGMYVYVWKYKIQMCAETHI